MTSIQTSMFCFLPMLLLWCTSTEAQVITNFSLYQPPNKLLGPLPVTINLAVVGRNLTIVANTSSTENIGKVVFKFDGVAVKTERTGPYAIAGSLNGALRSYPKMITLGSHSVDADLFHVNGTRVSRKSMKFVVVSNTKAPTKSPSNIPTRAPTTNPTEAPIITKSPTNSPSNNPTRAPTTDPTKAPINTKSPTKEPTNYPSNNPTRAPTTDPTKAPINTKSPTKEPTRAPSNKPTRTPTTDPTKAPINTKSPTKEPTRAPSNKPTRAPTTDPTKAPINTKSPTRAPITPLTTEPTNDPAKSPINKPTQAPTNLPPTKPTTAPLINFQVKGELRKWHKVTLAFVGPSVSENDTVNPFMNYRLDVLFSHPLTKKSYNVPGYFAADGNAAETSASSGDQWHCHFAPDEIGEWTFKASFTTGVDVATSTVPGIPTAFHGLTGAFNIADTNKSGRDLRGKGRLMHVGRHHLQFAETKEWFLKVGPDSPENFLAYDDFDNTTNYKNLRKSWEPHKKHFVPGIDPSWMNGKGTGIIGAINYLESQGMNAFSFLTMNIKGDDRNVYPYISSTDFLRMDVSKLAQWEILLDHADRKGFFMHFKLGETENDHLLNNGNLGNERKLYYRELIARFGHHLALNWNLGEEIDNSASQIISFSDYFRSVDPYQHMVVVHTIPIVEYDTLYGSLIGYPTIGGLSLQANPHNVFSKTLQWVSESALAGHKWIVTNDEQNSARDGVVPDAIDPNHDFIRQRAVWGNIMAGGAGVEYYFGYGHNNSDLTCQDFSSRQNMWAQSRYVLDFFRNNNIPFWEMSYDRGNRVDSQTGWILGNSGSSILVFYRRSLTTASTIDMTNLAGIYSIQWYNPRSGGPLQDGSIATIVGGAGIKNCGKPPNPLDTKDWAILLRKIL